MKYLSIILFAALIGCSEEKTVLKVKDAICVDSCVRDYFYITDEPIEGQAVENLKGICEARFKDDCYMQKGSGYRVYVNEVETRK